MLIRAAMKALVWALGVTFFTACSSSRNLEAPPVMAPQAASEYRIGVGDALQISVWRNPELSLAVMVRPDGKVSVPLIGDIEAANITSIQLAANITKALNEFVRGPQVTVIVSNPSSTDFMRRVRVTGAVNAPQSLPYREGMTIMDLVLLSGGPNPYASANKAKLYRKVDGETKVYLIKLEDILEEGKLETNYPLQPSDVITVPERLF